MCTKQLLISTIVALLLTTETSAFNVSQRRKTKKQVSTSEVVEKVKKIVADSKVAISPSNYFDSTFIQVEKAIPSAQKVDVARVFYDEMISNNIARNDSLTLEAALCYLMCDVDDDKNIAFTALISIYTTNKDKENLEWTLSEFEKYSTSMDGAFDEDIAKIKSDCNAILNPITMKEAVIGTWVSIDLTHQKSPEQPYTILKIDDAQINGAKLFVSDYYRVKKRGDILTARKFEQGKYARDGSVMLPISQGVIFKNDDKPEYLTMFSNYSIQRGNEALANMGHDNVRDLRSKWRATISQSNASFGKQIGATVATETFAGLLDIAFSSAAVSKSTVEEYYVNMEYDSPVCMNGHVTYIAEKNTSMGNRKSYTHANQDTRMVKWEESDSLIFVSQGGKPIFYGNTMDNNNPLLKRYNEVKRQYSYHNPKYLLSMIGCECLAVGIMTGGIYIIIDSFDQKDLIQYLFGISIATIGGVSAIIVPQDIFPSIFKHKRNKEYKKINMEGCEKLRKKAQAELSLYPTYDTTHNTIGAGLTLNF